MLMVLLTVLQGTVVAFQMLFDKWSGSNVANAWRTFTIRRLNVEPLSPLSSFLSKVLAFLSEVLHLLRSTQG
jgi:hypothetical protein